MSDGVAAKLGAGIDQKGAQRRGRAALEVLVVQDRGVLVVGDDVVVGHLLFALCAGLQVAHVRLVFGRSAAKRRQRGRMAARAQRARAAHAFELVARS